MRYQLVFIDTNPNLMTVQIDKEIRDPTSYLYPANLSDIEGNGLHERNRFLTDLCMVDGVTNIVTERYEVHVTRASGMFNWDDILRGILYTLSEHLDPNGGMEEFSPKQTRICKPYLPKPQSFGSDHPFDDLS